MRGFADTERFFLRAPRLAFHPGWVVLGIFLSTWLLFKAFRLDIAIACPWKASFGVPCVACGSGRALRALLAGEWVNAWWWNPLFVTALGVGALLVVAAAVQLVFGRRLVLPQIQQALLWKILLVVAVALNEIYLILAGM